MSEDTTVESSLDGLPEEIIDPMTGEVIDQKNLAEQLLAQAREQNIDPVGQAEPPWNVEVGGGLDRLPPTVVLLQ